MVILLFNATCSNGNCVRSGLEYIKQFSALFLGLIIIHMENNVYRCVDALIYEMQVSVYAQAQF